MKKSAKLRQPSPVNPDLLLAIDLQEQGRVDEAETLFKACLEANASDALALYSLGVIFLNRQEVDAALRVMDRGIKAAPRYSPMWFGHGMVLTAAGRREEALVSYQQAIAIDPRNINAMINQGVLLRQLHRHKEALILFNSILAIDPKDETALSNCAVMLSEFHATEESISMYERLLAVNPNFEYALGRLAYQRLHNCDWRDYERSAGQIVQAVRARQVVCTPLSLMMMSDNAADLQICSQIHAKHHRLFKVEPLWQGEWYQHDKIRIAYVSPDLREHPVGHLMAGVLELHDKTRFETIAISLGVDDQSRLRARMVKAFDHFIDARLMGSRQIAELMRSMEVDIAVDLAGISADARPDVFEYRPAPIQVNYLGFPGTSGADHMDYILVDRHVIPPEHQRYYNEKVVYLPDCYLPTDASVKISDRTPNRAECGLPETGFVFCSFSHDHKISPAIFDVWMRLLLQVPGSVMWLMSRNDLAVQNLRKEAQTRGVSPDRLVFAGRVPLVEDHLARYRQADLFIDTFPYNAHTTAADALMAGLPVITCMGNAFASRVAGSLLHSIGLSELIAATLADYEALALDLASNSQRLGQVRSKLLENRCTSPLFDTAKFCSNFEEVLSQMHSGQPAIDRFALSEDGNAQRVDTVQKSVASNVIEAPAIQPKRMADERKVAKKRCLHLGGLVRIAGWEVISDAPGAVVDHTGGVSDLSRFADDSFDMLHAHHVLEKLDYREQLLQALVEWQRVLKPGGVLAVTVVDLELLAAKLIDKRLDLSERFMAMRMMFGGHMDKSDYHQVGLTEEFLVSFLIEAGFAEARRVASFNSLEILFPTAIEFAQSDLNVLVKKPE